MRSADPNAAVKRAMLTLRGDLWLVGCMGRAGRGLYENTGDDGKPGGDLAGDFFAEELVEMGELLEDMLLLGEGVEGMDGKVLLVPFLSFFVGVVGSVSVLGERAKLEPISLKESLSQAIA